MAIDCYLCKKKVSRPAYPLAPDLCELDIKRKRADTHAGRQSAGCRKICCFRSRETQSYLNGNMGHDMANPLKPLQTNAIVLTFVVLVDC